MERLKRFLLAGVAVLVSWLATTPTLAEPEIKIVPEATAAARTRQQQQQLRQVRPETYDLDRYPVTDDNTDRWRNILWTTALVEPQEAYVAEALAGILSLTVQPQLSSDQQRVVEMAMQVGTQLYLSNPALYAPVEEQFLQTIEQSRQPKWVAMALSALVQSEIVPEQLQQLRDRVHQRFPNWTRDAHLYPTLWEIAIRNKPPNMPPLEDLLNWTIAPGQPQLYVLCQPDRGMLCRTILKDARGEFVRQSGRLWSVPLLLRSLHAGLAWNFTRGETPQGIYRIEGTNPPEMKFFRAFGSFPLVKLFVPYEAGVEQFLPGRSGRLVGGLAAYKTLLPPSWRNYFPIQQSYWAGKAGRSLFRIHGSGESTTFFSNSRRFPESSGWNPTIGCLSAAEVYDDSGKLQQADMPKILNVLKTARHLPEQANDTLDISGYLIVIEVMDASAAPIPLKEIEAAIAKRP